MSEVIGTVFKYLMMLLAIGGVVFKAYEAFALDKNSRFITDIATMHTNIQGFYNLQSTFTSLTTARAISGKLAPTSMVSGTELKNPWGGDVTVAVNASNAAQFDITTDTVPVDGCAKAVASLTKITGLTINGSAQTLPLDAGVAITNCNSDNNTMVFTFSR